MMEMDNGWVEVPAVHEPIVGTRFATKNVLRLRRTKRVRVELQRPVPHSLRPNRLPHDSRSCLAPLVDPLTQVAVPLRRSLHRCWLKESMMIPQLASHRRRLSVTLDKSGGSGAVGWNTIVRHLEYVVRIGG